jgi:predicted nucleic acid-binding protein
VVDTNVLFMRYVEPLVASAEAGDLAVYWSGTIVREFCKVAHRALLADALVGDIEALSDRRALTALISRVVAETHGLIEQRLRLLDLTFRWSPDTDAPVGFEDVSDPSDRPLFRAAHAAGADTLLTLDRRHLPHGRVLSGVLCWHPDTFLSLLYRQDPAAYERARRGIRRRPELRNLPRIL